MLPSFDSVLTGASLFSTFSLTSSGADVEPNVLVVRDPALRDENPAEGLLKRFFGFDESVVASAADSVEVGDFDWNLNRLRPAVKPPRLGASVVVVVASVVVVVVLAVVVRLVVVVVLGRTVVLSASESTVVKSSSLETVVASTSDFVFLSSSFAFSLARIAYKSIANFSINGVVSSSSSDGSFVLEAYSTVDFEAVSINSDFDNSVSMILGPFEFPLSFSSVTKLWLSTSSRLGRLTCCFFPVVSGAFSWGEADFARCGKRVTCGSLSSTYGESPN